MLTPDPVPPMRAAMGNPQFWNLYAYAGNNPTRFVDPEGLFVELPNCNEGETCAELELIKDTLEAAGASDLADALELETVNGVTRIAAVDAGLIDSANSTAELIGGLIDDQSNTASVSITTDPVGAGGAVAIPQGANRVDIRMNLSEINREGLVRAVPLSGPAAGRQAVGSMTPGPALVHEFGHARPHFQGFLIDTPALNQATTENFQRALAYENQHRKLLQGFEHFRRVDHGRLFQ